MKCKICGKQIMEQYGPFVLMKDACLCLKTKSYWEQDQCKYSETEIRYAVNKVVGSAWAFWIWPFHNIRFWFQERIIAVLEGLKPTSEDSNDLEIKTRKSG